MKHIVYCTTNLKNGKIYIGVHKTINPYEFDGYIGNGVKVPKDGRPFKINHPATAFKRAINKYGYQSFYRTTLAIFDTAEVAYKLEEALVTKEFLQSKISYNAVKGGEIPTPETKSVLQYSKDGTFIKQWDSFIEASEILGINKGDIWSSCTGRSVTCGGWVWRYVTNVTPEEKIEVREYKSRAPAIENRTTKRVVQYSKVGYKMKSFDSLVDAGNKLHVDPKCISLCCNNHENYNTAGGYRWRLESDNLESLPPLMPHPNGIVVEQLLNGEVIEEFDNSRRAAEYIGSPSGRKYIAKACKTGNEYKGYTWRFKG